MPARVIAWAWLSGAVEIGARVILLLAVALVLALLVDRMRPWVRYTFWRIACMGTLAIPILVLLAPTLELPIVSAGSFELAVPASVPLSKEVATPSGAASVWSGLAVASASTWLLGVLVISAYFGVGLFRAARGLRRCPELEARHVQHRLSTLARAVGVRPPRVVAIDSATPPASFGLLRPCILLPRDAESWDRETLDSVLLHELIHVRRHDWLVQVMTRLACALYWPIPLIWVAARRLGDSREAACDAAVLQLGQRPTEYARLLVTIASWARPPAPARGGIFMARRLSVVESRVREVLQPRRQASRAASIGLLTLVSALVFVAGSMRPRAGEAPSQPRLAHAADGMPFRYFDHSGATWIRLTVHAPEGVRLSRTGAIEALGAESRITVEGTREDRVVTLVIEADQAGRPSSSCNVDGTALRDSKEAGTWVGLGLDYASSVLDSVADDGSVSRNERIETGFRRLVREVERSSSGSR